jgi:hypothetical protein
MRGRLLLASALCASGFGIAVACTSSTPSNPGDNVIDDTHPPPTSTSPPADAGTFAYDSPYDVVSDGFYTQPVDGYSAVEGCNTCACSGSDDGGTFCFGGNGQTPFPTPTCDVDAAAGAIQVGCNPIPAACQSLPANQVCACILQALGHFSCYLACEISSTGYTAYCPNP